MTKEISNKPKFIIQDVFGRTIYANDYIEKVLKHFRITPKSHIIIRTIDNKLIGGKRNAVIKNKKIEEEDISKSPKAPRSPRHNCNKN